MKMNWYNWYPEVLKKYVVFSGRARRREYWYFTLVNSIILISLMVIDGIAGTFNMQLGLGVLSGIYTLAVLLPSIAVLVRRIHDIGRTGWWALLMIIPLIGTIVLFVFTLISSQAGTNKYGPNPITRGH